jgi:CRP-like cAMP-binding protein
MNKVESFRSFFLFKGLSDKIIDELLCGLSLTTESFSRGDVVFSKDIFSNRIGFVLSGKCEVLHTRADGSAVVINVLNEGDSFGVLAAFSENEFPTEIVASIASKITFFEKSDITSLIKSNGDIAMNIIDFMVDRIEFLNNKIVTFSGENVEQKLASYILTEAKTKGEIFGFNRKKAAEAISAGRASVYRALDSFTESGILKYDSKKIYILNFKGLERIKK